MNCVNDTNMELLDRITKAYNKDVDQRYKKGLLDFIPEPSTADEILTTILATFAAQHFPDVLALDESNEANIP